METNSSQLGLIDGKRFEDWPKWDGQGVPLRENCDMNNPRQRFLWMFTALPGVKGAPLLLPVEYWETVSWRQCVLGSGIVDDPGLKYRPPANMANHWTASGEWVDLDAPDVERKTLAEVVEGLTAADKADLRNIMLDKIGLREPEIPIGQYRVSDLAKRVGKPVDELVSALADFGLTVTADSLVGRDIIERIMTHLGL